MWPRSAVLALAVGLSGCVSVSVYAPGAPPTVIHTLGGVTIQRTGDDALEVSETGVGFIQGCSLAALGFSQVRCALMPAATGCVAIVEDAPPAAREWWGKASEYTRAKCLPPHQGTHP